MKADTKLLLVGCGKMGGAILQRLAGKVSAVIVEPGTPLSALKSLPNTLWLASADRIDASFKPDVIVLAIKPQNISSTLPAYAKYKDSVLLSIAAGTSITTMEKLLGNPNHAIVRTMPNLPASIGFGMSVAVANKNASVAQRNLCDDILKAVGETAWVDDEQLIDAVTALSGSGPAYVFALCEAMAKAGTAIGLSADMANKLARQTIIGSGALLAQSQESAETLRIAVTSPGGTTEAGLKELLAPHGLGGLIQKTLNAAWQRAKELAKLA